MTVKLLRVKGLAERFNSDSLAAEGFEFTTFTTDLSPTQNYKKGILSG